MTITQFLATHPFISAGVQHLIALHAWAELMRLYHIWLSR